MGKVWGAGSGAVLIVRAGGWCGDRKLCDTAPGGSATAGASGSGGSATGGHGGSGGAGQDGGVVDCIGKPAGTDCSPGGATGSICLNGECVVSRCGDGYVDMAIGEDCEGGDGCNACKYGCKLAADCNDGDACNGAETCDTMKHACAGGTPAADGTMCTLSGGAPRKCPPGPCLAVPRGTDILH